MTCCVLSENFHWVLCVAHSYDPEQSTVYKHALFLSGVSFMRRRHMPEQCGKKLHQTILHQWWPRSNGEDHNPKALEVKIILLLIFFLEEEKSVCLDSLEIIPVISIKLALHQNSRNKLKTNNHHCNIKPDCNIINL